MHAVSRCVHRQGEAGHGSQAAMQQNTSAATHRKDISKVTQHTRTGTEVPKLVFVQLVGGGGGTTGEKTATALTTCAAGRCKQTDAP